MAMGVQKRTGIVNEFCTVSRGDLQGSKGKTAEIDSENDPWAGSETLANH
jgi:hypothetical protein